MTPIQEAVMNNKQKIGLRLELARVQEEPNKDECEMQEIETSLASDDVFYATQHWHQALSDFRIWLAWREYRNQYVVSKNDALAKLNDLKPSESTEENDPDHDWEIRFGFLVEFLEQRASDELDVRVLQKRLTRLDNGIEEGQIKLDRPTI